MFYDIWEYAFDKYKKQKKEDQRIKYLRTKFKLENQIIRDKFKIKYKHISKKEYSLLKYVLKKNTNKKLDLEYLDAVNNLYQYYIISS